MLKSLTSEQVEKKAKLYFKNITQNYKFDIF